MSPILECNSSIWSHIVINDAKSIEKVQQHFINRVLYRRNLNMFLYRMHIDCIYTVYILYIDCIYTVYIYTDRLKLINPNSR